MARQRAVDPELGDLTRLSRVELEPVLASLTLQGQVERAAVVQAELASRTWQWHNPYV